MNNAFVDGLAAAESYIRSALSDTSPGEQMETLLRAYRQANNKSLFAQALIGNLVCERRARKSAGIADDPSS